MRHIHLLTEVELHPSLWEKGTKVVTSDSMLCEPVIICDSALQVLSKENWRLSRISLNEYPSPTTDVIQISKDMAVPMWMS